LRPAQPDLQKKWSAVEINRSEIRQLEGAKKRRPLSRPSFSLAGKLRLVAIASVAAIAAAAATATTSATAAAEAASATTAAATSATAAAKAAAATTAAASPAIFTRTGLVDRQGAAAVVGAIERCDCRLRLGIRTHLNEAETFRPPGVPVGDDFRALDCAMRGKHLFQLRTANRVGQIPYIQSRAHRYLL